MAETLKQQKLAIFKAKVIIAEYEKSKYSIDEIRISFLAKKRK
jgi:hypothetical protein